MSVTRGEGRILSRPRKWFTVRLAIYLMIAVFTAQAFIGIAGLGKGGEWIVSALACEMFCALWMARQYGLLPAWTFPPMAMDESPRKVKIISIAPDIMDASLVEVSEAENGMLRRLINDTSGIGTSLMVHGTGKEVVGILLSKDEFELLHSAARIAREPERLEELSPEYLGAGVGVEEVFDKRG